MERKHGIKRKKTEDEMDVKGGMKKTKKKEDEMYVKGGINQRIKGRRRSGWKKNEIKE
jgi:hypothetical protein